MRDKKGWKRQAEGRGQREAPGATFQLERLESGDSDDSERSEGFDWQPYRPEQGKGGKKVKDLNAASVSRIARKIMAREWARALGGKSFDRELARIESKGSEYRLKKAAETARV